MEKKIFLSADIEGTCGIAAWEETEPEHGAAYAPFRAQMSREVSAACEGVLAGGADAVFIRDAHDTARNIDAALLPDDARIRLFRGWARDPYAMMSGIDASYAGAMFTGYHSGGGWTGSPLSHTMNLQNVGVTINGESATELMMNALTAAEMGVPTLLVAGDRMLCDWFQSKVPAAKVVPVCEGLGAGSISIMPGEAVRRIRAAAEEAMALNPAACMFPTAEHYVTEIHCREHMKARAISWYPGASLVDDRTVRYESDRWFDVLTFYHFCL